MSNKTKQTFHLSSFYIVDRNEEEKEWKSSWVRYSICSTNQNLDSLKWLIDDEVNRFPASKYESYHKSYETKHESKHKSYETKDESYHKSYVTKVILLARKLLLR